MATSISSYSVGFGMDASSYINGAQLSRKETAALVKDIESFRSPAEQLEMHQNRLTDAFNKGAIDLNTYNRLMKEHSTKLGESSAGMDLSIKGLGGIGIALGALTAAWAAAIAAGVEFVGFLRDQQNAIDDNLDSAMRLGVGYNDLKSLQFGFQEGAGIDPGTVQDSIKKMLINTAKAVEGDESINEAFGKLGLNAGEMLKMGATEQIMAIADGFQSIDSHAERLKLAMEIFGKSGADLASTLADGRDALQESIDFQQQWNSLSEEQQAAVAANNDAWDRIALVFDGLTDKMAAEFAPVMEVIADQILSLMGGAEGVDESMRYVVDSVVLVTGHLADGLELLTSWVEVIRQIGMGDFSGAADAVSSAMTFDKGQAALDALNTKREEYEQKAAAKAEERERAKQALIAKETTDTANKMEQSRDALEKEEERRRQEEERHQDQLAAKALKAAEDALAAEENRQAKMRAEVAKGPGSGMEEGSAEAAKFMAQQMNNAIADGLQKPDVENKDAKLLEEAQKQLEIQKSQDKTQKEMLAAIKENGFKRIR